MMKAKKRFSQNFLVNEQQIVRILDSLDLQKDDHVIEIGSGHGELSRYIAKKVNHLDLIEIDRSFEPDLENVILENQNVSLYFCDILKFKLKDIFKGKKLRIVGNLPYNISSQVLFFLFDNMNLIKDIHCMLQKEVVKRVVANVNSSDYGRLTVMVDYFCYKREFLFEVPARNFFPVPKVSSAFLSLIPRTETDKSVEFDLFSKIVKLAFSLKRKMLRNVFKDSLSTDILERMFFELNICPTMRPENLTFVQYINIAKFIESNLQE